MSSSPENSNAPKEAPKEEPTQEPEKEAPKEAPKEELKEVAKELVEEVVTNTIEDAGNALEEIASDIIPSHIIPNNNTLDNTLETITESNIVIEIKEEIKNVSNQVFDSAYEEVKNRMGEAGIKASTLAIAIRYTMEAIEKTPVKGKDQMDFALRIISELINELDDSEEKTFLRQTIDNGGVKETIELVILASKGKLDINTVVNVGATNCLEPCYQYIINKFFN